MKHSSLCSIPEQAVGCYCCLLEQERSPEQPEADGNGYVICFMGGSEKGLNLYPFVEADIYIQHYTHNQRCGICFIASSLFFFFHLKNKHEAVLL